MIAWVDDCDVAAFHTPDKRNTHCHTMWQGGANLTDYGFKAVIRNIGRQLETLGLKRCFGSTAEGYKKMADVCTNLTSLDLTR